MAAALEDTTVTYEDLASIERDFEDAELEITKTQTRLLQPLYASRALTTAQIPNFWPLVLEQAPPDIDQYIQPSDSAVLLSSLSSLSVEHFEFASNDEPRSLSIKWEFKENEYFADRVLEKKFWFRRDKRGFSGLVSEPVKIEWKGKEKDLTAGLLGLVCESWEEEKQANAKATSTTNGKGKGKGKGPDQKKSLPAKQALLKKKIENTGMGGMSFFAWFGFIGRRVSAEESAEASKLWKEKKLGGGSGSGQDGKGEEDEENEDEDDDLSYELEIFPDGDDLAIAISEDLWPGAIKYFTQAQELDALSDADFESDDEEDGISDIEGSASESEAPPAKKRKS